MIKNNQKCSLEKHKNLDAKSYCPNCKIYMCGNCEKYHLELFTNHTQFSLDKGEEIFTGLCKENNHNLELEYYCKNHNVLCCLKCISKIKQKGNGGHHDCEIYFAEDFEKEKKTKLNDNINILEGLFENLGESIRNIKMLTEKMNDKKEELKTYISKKFTNLRNALNEKEDKLLQQIDKIYNFGDFSILNDYKIKEIERLEVNSKKLISKIKTNNYNWKNNKLNSLINDCLYVENNIKKINDVIELNQEMKKYNPFPFNICKFSSEQDIDKLFEKIKNFGTIEEEDEIKLFDSNIQINEKEVRGWLNNRKFIAKLLYRKSRDGSNPKDFHSRCDNKGITITFIEEYNGSKFGGYTELGWEGSGAKKDKSSFIFNFRGKYMAKDGKDSIYCGPNYGPTFGTLSSSEIYFCNSLNNGTTYQGNSEDYTYFSTSSNESNIDFEVKELEVYKIIYL